MAKKDDKFVTPVLGGLVLLTLMGNDDSGNGSNGDGSNGSGGTPNDPPTNDPTQNTPPTAGFQASVEDNGETLSLDASMSTDPDGSIEQYFWEVYRNGTRIATDSRVNAIVDVSPGNTYNVDLTVTDDAGATDTRSGTIDTANTNPGPSEDPVPVVNYSVESQLFTHNLFLDGTESHDPDGEITDYEWTVRKGGDVIHEASGSTAELRGIDSGVYDVRLVVKNVPDGEMAWKDVQVNVDAPEAEYDHVAELDPVVGPIGEPSFPIELETTGDLLVLDAPSAANSTGNSFTWDAIAAPSSVPARVAFNGSIDRLDWDGGMLHVYVDGTQRDPYAFGNAGPGYTNLSGTSQVAEITMYTTQTVYEKYGWGPSQSFASYVAGSFDAHGVSYDIKFKLGPIDTPVDRVACPQGSEETVTKEYWDGALSGSAVDGWQPSVRPFIQRKDSNMLATDSRGGGCADVGGDAGVHGVSGFDTLQEWPGEETRTDTIGRRLYPAMHELGHNLGYGHRRGGALQFYDSEMRWHHSPCGQVPGTTNVCGEQVPERERDRETGKVKHLYYSDCTVQEIFLGSGGYGSIGGGFTGQSQASRLGRGSMGCPECGETQGQAYHKNPYDISRTLSD